MKECQFLLLHLSEQDPKEFCHLRSAWCSCGELFSCYGYKYFVWNRKFGEVIRSSGSNVKTIETGRLAKRPVIMNLTKSNIPLIILQPSGVSIPEEIIISNFLEVIEECLSLYNEVHLRPHLMITF